MPVLAAIGLISVIAPILIFTYPAIQDYPNHLARIFILTNIQDPTLAANYRIDRTLTPNLGWDLLALALHLVLPLDLAGRGGLLIITGGLCAGTFVFHRALNGRWSWTPIIALPLLYNIGMTKGFLAYDISLALALLAAGWWVAAPPARWLLRLIVATLFATLLYVMHFAGFAAYGIIVLGVEIEKHLARPREQRSLVHLLLCLGRDGLQAVPAGILLLITSLHAVVEPTGVEMVIQGFQTPDEAIAQFFWATDTGYTWLSQIVGGCIAIMVAWAVWTRRLMLPTLMRTPLLLFCVLVFALPQQIYGTGYVTSRASVAFAFFLFASLRQTMLMDARSMQKLVTGIVFLSLAIGFIRLPAWIETQRGVRDFTNMAEQIPVGSRVFAAHVGMEPDDLVATAIGLYHVASYGVITRKFLVQSMFAFPGQQPLRFRDPALKTAPKTSDTFIQQIARNMCRRGLLLREHLFHFDYILMHGPPGKRLETAVMPHPWYSQAGKSGEFRLYRRDPALPVPRPIGHCLRYDLHPAGT